MHCVYTNRQPSSAFRGFGVTEASFATEMQMDRIARAIGVDPWTLRLRNAYRDGDERPYRKIVEDATLIETIQAAAELVGAGAVGTKLYGRGIAAVNYPTGMNLGGDPTQALVHATTVGNFVITLSSVDLGQGLKTVLAQIGAEALGVPFETVRVDTGDTDTGPHCMGTFASRATHRAGNAIMRAADEAKRGAARGGGRGDGGLARRSRDRRRGQRARDRLARLVDDSRWTSRWRRTSSTARRSPAAAMYMKPKSEVVPETGEMDPDSTEAHACTVADVEVDTETGDRARAAAGVGLRDRLCDQPGARPGPDPRRRVDGHVALPVRDDRALLPRDRPRAGRLLRRT